jgi:hypothetical protein
MADVMGGVVDGADVREADHANDEKAQSHRQHSLSDRVRVDGGSGQLSGLGMLHVVSILGDDIRFSPERPQARPNFAIVG